MGMIKALLLIFDTNATWERIQRAQRCLLFILAIYVLPLLVLTSAAEGYGMIHWGKYRGDVPKIKVFSHNETVLFEIMNSLLWLGIIFLGAKLVKALGETFHGRHTYRQCFTVVAYGLSPVFLLRVFDAFSAVSPWVTWAIGILLSIRILYYGVPQILQPDPPHAFGLYFMSSLLLFVITGLARFVTAWYLRGKFGSLETLFTSWGITLPF
jgi:hypothetical protein